MGATLDPSASTKAWALWLGATVATFAALEAHAVSSRRIPTLSGCLRSWLGLDPVKPYRHVLGGAFSLFFGWLVAHVVFGAPPNLKERRHA